MLWSIKLKIAVQPGHRALIFDRLAGGIQEKVKTEGLNFLIPIKQIPIIFDVRITPTLIRAETLSKGGVGFC